MQVSDFGAAAVGDMAGLHDLHHDVLAAGGILLLLQIAGTFLDKLCIQRPKATGMARLSFSIPFDVHWK